MRHKSSAGVKQCQGSNSEALLKFAGKNSQNMAAGGFCVSDCSSPHRPSCCHYRPVPPLRSTRINCVLNMGGVHIYASELGVHTAKQQFNRNFIAKIQSSPPKRGKKRKKKHQQIRSISDGFTACTRFNARQLSFANVEGAET